MIRRRDNRTPEGGGTLSARWPAQNGVYYFSTSTPRQKAT